MAHVRDSLLSLALLQLACGGDGNGMASAETGSETGTATEATTVTTADATGDPTSGGTTADTGSETSASSTTDDATTGMSTSGTDESGSTTGTAGCGDGDIGPEETCDDGNTVDNDGCDADCVPSGVVEVGAGREHTCVRTRTGAVRCWGSAFNGHLGHADVDPIGDDEPASSGSDVDVGAAVLNLSLGGFVTCSRVDPSNVRCWGTGYTGQLGYGNTDNIGDDETPASAGDVNVGGDVVHISAGGDHTCAVLDGGTVRCWGDNFWGQLGYGNYDVIGDDETPADAGDVNVGGPVEQISVGRVHACALLEAGTLRCWGPSGYGHLGYGNYDDIGDDEDPADAGDVDVGGTVVQVSAGGAHTCAVLEGGTVRCWGHGEDGRLGYANENDVSFGMTPSMAGDVSIPGTVQQVAAGERHTCALLDGGQVRCWGSATNGRLGYGNANDIGDDETPAPAGDVPLGGTVVQISAGMDHTCAVLDTGAVRCWGMGLNGQLGHGNTDDIGDDEFPNDAGDVPVFE